MVETVILIEEIADDLLSQAQEGIRNIKNRYNPSGDYWQYV